MQPSDPARTAALAVLIAVAASAAAGIAALARLGGSLCDRRLFSAHEHTAAMAGMAGMHAPPAPAGGGICPIVLFASFVALGLSLGATAMLVRSGERLTTVLRAAAGIVVSQRFGWTFATAGACGAVPLAFIVHTEAHWRVGGTAAFAMLGALAVGGLLTALALAGAARLILAFARSIIVAAIAALRTFAPGGDTVFVAVPRFVPVASGAVPARCGPPRAPPSPIR
jgi:hypothetical protein